MSAYGGEVVDVGDAEVHHGGLELAGDDLGLLAAAQLIRIRAIAIPLRPTRRISASFWIYH